MSEDIGNVEADLEALMAALELAGVLAEQSRRQAMRLAQHVRKAPPRSREDWADRARLMDVNGQRLGWLDTSKAQRINLDDPSGAGDRNLTEARRQTAESPRAGSVLELEGQHFEVQAGARKGDPERVRPISVQEAQARIAEHRPDMMEHGAEAAAAGAKGRENETESAGEAMQRLRTVADERPAWTAAPEAREAGAGGGQSAAEAFGASRVRRGPGPAAEPAAAPSDAELTAVGATRTASPRVER